MNYYNEIDPQAAQWLRNLIAAGHLPAGDVDERSIEDVRPDDLRGYVQCHFFAGIGGWPYALALAGWPTDRPVWTGSCPCQPFSAAGKGAGFADERHLWPAWQHLIAQCRPAVIFGEQVASKAVGTWIDLVHADLEGMGYAFGCVPFPAAGVGAPHIRDRTYWVADADGDGRRQGLQSVPSRYDQPARCGGEPVGMADAGHHGLQGRVLRWSGTEWRDKHGSAGRDGAAVRTTEPAGGGTDGMADTDHDGREPRCVAAEAAGHWYPVGPTRGDDRHVAAGPTNGQWGSADWLCCTDGKWRPVEPGTQPLADGLSSRVVRLRAYGNAIVPAQAAEFIRAYAEAIGLILPALERAA